MASDVSLQTEVQFRKALGRVKPKEAWAQIVQGVEQFSLDNPGEWEQEASQVNEEQPSAVIEYLKEANPVKALRIFNQMNPQLDLKKLSELSNSLLTKAALQIFAE